MRRTCAHLLAAILLVFALGMLAGCGDDEDTAETTETAEEGTDSTATADGESETTQQESTRTEDLGGEELFATICANCHGSDGTGGTGPDLTRLSLDPEAIANQVRNGGGGMPAYGDSLSDDAIDTVAEYVAQEFMQ